MKVKELKEFLNRVDDDFDVVIGATKTIPENERGTEGYAAYPTEHFRFSLNRVILVTVQKLFALTLT